MRKNFLFKWVAVLGAMLLLANVVLPGLAYADEEIEQPASTDKVACIGEWEEHCYSSLRAAIESEAATDGVTINLVADDHTSFDAEHLEMQIDKNITIDGKGFSLYWIKDFAWGDDHDIFIKWNKDVTIQNMKLTEFASDNYAVSNAYPIWTSQAYEGTLTLKNVTIDKFNRTAVNIWSWNIIIDECEITWDLAVKGEDGYFQWWIENHYGNVTVTNTTIKKVWAKDLVYLDEEHNWSIAGAIQISGNGTINVWEGNDFDGEYSLISNSNAAGGKIIVTSWVINGEFDEETVDTFEISGWSFDNDPTEYLAENYFAFEENGRYVVGEAREVSEIAISWIVKPVAWNTATTEGITITTKWVELKDAYWILNETTQVEESTPEPDNSELDNSEPKSIQTLKIAESEETDEDDTDEDDTQEVNKFTWTFEEGKQYVLHVTYAFSTWYNQAESGLTINEEAQADEEWDIKDNGDKTYSVDFTYTASAKPASNKSSWWGGGGSSKTTKAGDTTATTWDNVTVDDTNAENNNEENVNEENKDGENAATMTEAQAVEKFGQEQIDAYKWALGNGITTMKTVEAARLDEPLTRAELAKMMVVYIQKVLEKDPVVTGDVSYPDVDESLGDLYGYIKLAYQYQIMGINADGTPIEFFNPNGLVTRWEYATVFSRVLFGDKFNKDWADFYSKHLEALKAAWILTNTIPTIHEMRGWVMLMMYRSSQNTEAIEKVANTTEATEEESSDETVNEEKVSEENENTEESTANNNEEVATENAEETTEAEATEVATWDVAEAPAAEASTWDVATN